MYNLIKFIQDNIFCICGFAVHQIHEIAWMDQSEKFALIKIYKSQPYLKCTEIFGKITSVEQ